MPEKAELEAVAPLPKSDRVRYLADQLNLGRRIRVVDIGARLLTGDTPYQLLFDADLCDVVGFEPQEDEFEKLQASKGPRETYINCALGNGRETKLNFFHHPGFTSNFSGLETARQLVVPLKKAMRPRGQIDIKTRRLDDVDLGGAVDFIKIDVQGSELNILKSGKKSLNPVVGIYSEVRLFSIYEDEPGLGDLNKEMLRQGFQPHNLINIRRFKLTNSFQYQLKRHVGRQIIDADMIYLRDLSDLESYSDDQLKVLALLADGVFDSVDVVLMAIDELTRRDRVVATLAEQYFNRLPPRMR